MADSLHGEDRRTDDEDILRLIDPFRLFFDNLLVPFGQDMMLTPDRKARGVGTSSYSRRAGARLDSGSHKRPQLSRKSWHSICAAKYRLAASLSLTVLAELAEPKAKVSATSRGQNHPRICSRAYLHIL